MHEPPQDRIEALLARAGAGDADASTELLSMYRSRLRQMVRCRMDIRLRQRFDPSDVIQEALQIAAVKMPQYLRQRPVSFYPWLRRLAWECLVDLQREHLDAQRRTVTREEIPCGNLPDESLYELAQSSALSGTEPLEALLHEERLARLRTALQEMDAAPRELLVLRYVEGLPLNEVAEVLDISLASAKMRHLRAVRQLRDSLSSA